MKNVSCDQKMQDMQFFFLFHTSAFDFCIIGWTMQEI